MENINVSKLKPEFDWDAIVVGDYLLDHSQNFFAAANKENQAINIDKSTSTLLAKLSLRNGNDPIKKEPIKDTISDKLEIMTVKENMEERMGTTTQEVQPEPQQQLLTEGVDRTQYSNNPDQSPGDAQTKTKLRLDWSIMQPAPSIVPAATAQPKAYGFKDVYQKKRDLAMRQREEEERKAREFHSRPMPNFKAMHKRLEDVQVVHFITVPKTPETLKHWYADVERRKQKDQMRLQEQEQRTKPPRRLALQQQQYRRQPLSQMDEKKNSHHPSGLTR